MPGRATTGGLNPQPHAASVSHPGPSQDSRPCQAADPDTGPFWPGQLGFKLWHCHLAPADSHHAQLQHGSNSFHFQHEQQPHQQQQSGGLERLAAREQLLCPRETAETERGSLLQVIHTGVDLSLAQTFDAVLLLSQPHSGTLQSRPQRARNHLKPNQW